MSGIPPEVELAAVIELASAQLGVPASEVRPLEGGQIARTFALSANGEEYVLQFHRDNLDATFEKTAAMADVFGSDRLPIPQVLRFGMFRDLRFALARRARGQPFSSLSPEAQTRALPSLMDTLDALHSQDLSLARLPALGRGGGTRRRVLRALAHLLRRWPSGRDALRRSP